MEVKTEKLAYFESQANNRDKWKKRNSYYYDYLESFIGFLVPSSKKVLEIGCGTGSLLPKLKAKTALGIDINPKMIEYARKNYSKENIRFEIGTAENLKDLNKSKFDYIVASDFLGYVDDVQGILAGTLEFLEDNGRIVITQYNMLWEPILRLASKVSLRMPMEDQSWLSMFDLKNFANLAGMEVVKSGSKMLIPKYIPLISAFFNKFIANIFPFSRLGVFHYIVLKKQGQNYRADSVGFMGHNPSVSIVVPTRNEAGTIQKIVDELPVLGVFTEIIFVEGNSTDNTYEVIKRVCDSYKGPKKLKYSIQTGKGKGDAVRKGFDMAIGDIFMIYDADMTVPASDLSKFYYAITSGKADFINGSRLVYPLGKNSMRIINLFGNKFFSLMFSAILGQPLKDTLCGTKVLWKKDYESIKEHRVFFGNFDPFGDFDLLFGAAKLNLKIIDLPIHYKERVYGDTNIHRWSHGWLLLKMTIFAARKVKFI